MIILYIIIATMIVEFITLLITEVNNNGNYEK